jgi:hypothetical protein
MEVNTSSTTDPVNMYDYMNNVFLNPTIFIIIFIIIVSYIILFSSLGSNNDTMDNNNSGTNMIGIFIFVILLLLVAFNAFQYFFSINVTAYIKDFFTNKPIIDIVVDQTNTSGIPVPEIRRKKQVFNIPGNTYNYTNAKALCTAYGSRLANYKEIEDSYKNGGEWCNYGWSDGQMALFPTQQKTFDTLQTIKGHEQDCGRPGINGGYMINPNLKFGVNCYGHKPRITNEEEELMNNTTPYPLTAEDIAFQARVDYWKNKVNDILVSPFNAISWSA